jgi:hypothetical protein
VSNDTENRKRFGKVISLDSNRWIFETCLENSIGIKSQDDLIRECELIFNQTKALTGRDIEWVMAEIKPLLEK